MIFKSNTIFLSLSTSFLKMALCALGTEYGLSWYGLAYGCTSIYKGLVFQETGAP